MTLHIDSVTEIHSMLTTKLSDTRNKDPNNSAASIFIPGTKTTEVSLEFFLDFIEIIQEGLFSDFSDLFSFKFDFCMISFDFARVIFGFFVFIEFFRKSPE